MVKTLEARACQGFDVREIWRDAAAAGVFRLSVPVVHGGAGWSLADALGVFREICRISTDLPMTLSLAAHGLIATDLLIRFGTGTQRERWLPGLLDGTLIAAIANSENGCGTDLTRMRSRVETGADESWKVEVEKQCATNLGSADLVFFSAWNGNRIETFLTGMKDWEQWSLARELEGFQTGLTGGMRLNGNLPRDQSGVLATGCGFEVFRRCFDLERILIGELCLGAVGAVRARLFARLEAMHRSQPDKLRNQYFQEKFVEVVNAESAIHALVREGHGGFPDQIQLSRVKYLSVEKAARAVECAVEVSGHSGLLRSSGLSRILKDLGCLRFLGGTRELHKKHIFESVLAGLAGERDRSAA